MKPGIGLLVAVTIACTPAAARGGDPPDNASSLLPALSSYVQLRYTDPSKGDGPWAIRRLKAIIDGGSPGGFRYHLQFIYKTNLGSVTDNRVFLQDAHAVIRVARDWSLQVGQFVPPFGLERFEPDRDLDFVDRTDVTNRMVVNGDLGKSFARDRGVEADWARGGWLLSAGLFQGAGANMDPRGNGPLGVVRTSYGTHRGGTGTDLHWRTGLAVSDRRDEDQNFSSQFPGVSKTITSHFQGRDTRLDAFVEAGVGAVRGQAELFRTWLAPRSGVRIAAHGAYAQMAYFPVSHVILAARYEWFTPDVRESASLRQDLWTVAATVDVPRTPLRLAADYSHPTTRFAASRGDVVRFQVQWIFPTWHPVRAAHRPALRPR